MRLLRVINICSFIRKLTRFSLIFKLPGARFSKAPEAFLTRKAIFG